MNQKKLLYLECYSGISGDMTVGALLDLGADKQVLKKALDSLCLEGFKIEIKEVQKSGIRACDFHVILDKPYENHDHDHSYLHNYKETEIQNITSHHSHRNLSAVLSIIANSNLTQRAKKIAVHTFEILANAESKAHGVSVQEVHFHEVGAVDSIVDIAAIAVCLDNLLEQFDISEVICSDLYEGKGQIRCQHGILPIPVPAVSNIAAAYQLPIHIMDIEGEFVTPTGAAIIAAICSKAHLPSKFKIEKVGIGSGKRNYEKASILRAMILEEEDSLKENSIWVLETNIDDSTGETLSFTLEQLLEKGALDTYFIPIYMKKNRPAYLLNVICEQSVLKTLEDIIFKHTTTIGIRKYQVERTILEREVKQVKTSIGEVFIKVCHFNDTTYYYPEYESVKQIANLQKISFSEAYHIIKTESSSLL